MTTSSTELCGLMKIFQTVFKIEDNVALNIKGVSSESIKMRVVILVRDTLS